MRRSSMFNPLATLVLSLTILNGAIAADDDDKNITKLAVRGTAELEKPADQLRLSIGVINEGRDATEVLEENSRSMTKVVAAVKKAGLTSDEYSTGRFRVMPVYSRRPRKPDPDWKPVITGYRVTNTINVKTLQLDLAAELIEAANKAGANSIDSISFTLSDPRKYRTEAIEEATRNAIEDATVLAETASLRLVRIFSITLDSAQPQAPTPMSRRMMMAGAAMETTTPIEPGDVTIRASVNIVYEIAPREQQ